IKKSDKKNNGQHPKECEQRSGLQKSYKRPVSNFASRKESSHQANYYLVPQEALLAQQSKETLDISSNSSLETSSTVSSQNLSAETSPKQSSGGEAKALTILVGDDKSYEMIPSSMSENLPLKVNNNLNGNGNSFAGSRQKAFLLDNDSKQHQDKSSLEKFQERQKLMEEQNKRKKELLTKAIADRKRQTQFEAKKLLQVQEELSRLDALLSTDVGILRNQIELS
ncbi:UNVERIFIED_CONTAM: hypothetical protein GTU68_007281, partial [Idotea baltica]|nr:hypothetical protein [Idotea baltica]